MADVEAPTRQRNILFYGLERKGLPTPNEPLKSQNFCVYFESYGTARRFQEYDGVVLFQGIFEKFGRSTNYIRSYLTHEYDTDELDKRKKEAALLLSNSGFLCFLLTDPFIDSDDGRDFSSTDLTKCHLNYQGLYRENFRKRVAHVTPAVSEFKRFLEVFGAANTHFNNLNDAIDFRVLAQVRDRPVGFLLEQAEYFVPSLVPDARPDVVTEYVELLVDAVTSVHNKLHQSIPDWVAAYEFEEEIPLHHERADLISKVADIDERLAQLAKYKAALIHTGPALVSDVKSILEVTLGINVDAEDEFREDIKLIGEDKTVLAVCEIKGINRGIKRENINQTDSHRERSGFSDTFPAILIANTNIKSARAIDEKDQELAPEQVRHAVNMHVLLIRTIDLLGLLRLVLAGKLSSQSARTLVLENAGWLRIQGNDVNVLHGT